jgi:anti-sigma regulatory factor (Ser/Thr protein kinase)
MESGKLTVHPVAMSVLEAVTDACNTHSLSAAAKGVTFSWEPPSDLPSVTADPTRLRQILIILLDNAVKFTPPGGAVKIQVRHLPLEPQFLLLEVSDTGCGMSAEAAEKAFDRLYQVADSNQSRRGMGLGLFICKELVVRQGGQIRVQSQPQVGSVFSFTLPVFSLGKLIAPLIKDQKWPTESIALLTVITSFQGFPPRNEFEEEWAREVRDLVALCLMPNLDVLLPRMKYGAEGERFYVVAFADEQGASILARRIRVQCENLPHFNHAGLTLSVSHTMLKPFPSKTAVGADMVNSVATNVEELIKSQELKEGIRDEQQKSPGD